jgi:hypothetical protein
MDPLSIASFGIGVGSSILGAKFGFDQADQMQKETQEGLRRFFRTSAKTYSMAQAQGGASGITADSGSLTKYLADMSAEFTKQANWMQEAGDQRADATRISSLFNGLSSFGSSLFSFGQANNWYRSPTIK